MRARRSAAALLAYGPSLQAGMGLLALLGPRAPPANGGRPPFLRFASALSGALGAWPRALPGSSPPTPAHMEAGSSTLFSHIHSFHDIRSKLSRSEGQAYRLSKLTYGRCTRQLHQDPAFVGQGSGRRVHSFDAGILGQAGCRYAYLDPPRLIELG